MAKEKLTKRSVERLPVREANYIAFDTELPGFGVRVMPSGKRFFLIQYRRHGRTRRVMLGQLARLRPRSPGRRRCGCLATSAAVEPIRRRYETRSDNL